MGLPIHPGDVVVRRRPHVEHLVGGPDGAAADATPEDVVIDLVVEKELGVVGAEPARVVFAFGALDLERVEEKVPAAADQPEQAEIAQEHESDPIRLELDATRQRGLQVKPGDHRDEQVNGIPRPKEPGIGQQPLQYGHGPGRPLEQGRVLDRIRRLPLAFGIADAKSRRRCPRESGGVSRG